MSILNYYIEHFNELKPDNKFHFATRLLNWSRLGFLELPEEDSALLRNFLETNEPSHDLRVIYENNDFSKVNFLEERKPYFEKYDHLFSLEATLFRIHHLKVQYGVDLSKELFALVSSENLDKICTQLLSDEAAFATLSTYAVNVLSLVDRHLQPVATPARRTPSGDLYLEMLDLACSYKSSHPEYKNSLFIYLVTHIIICDSAFYSQQVPTEHQKPYQDALKSCENLIQETSETISLDIQIEFLVCCRLVGFSSRLEPEILARCRTGNHPFIQDPSRPANRNTLSGAEHRNVLFIMAGLDS